MRRVITKRNNVQKSNHSNSTEAMSRPEAAKTSSPKPAQRTRKFPPAVQRNTKGAQTPQWDLLCLCIQCKLFDFAQRRLRKADRRQYVDAAAETSSMAAASHDCNHLLAPGVQLPNRIKQNLTPPQIHHAFLDKLRQGSWQFWQITLRAPVNAPPQHKHADSAEKQLRQRQTIT